MAQLVANRRVTLRHLATKLGFHLSTVSLALRNSPKLPARTCRKVQKLARRMGYRPDPMLTAISVYRKIEASPRYQATIAWINNWPGRRDMLGNHTHREYCEGARERAEECGYVLEDFWLLEPGLKTEKLGRVFKARNIQALLFAPQPKAQPLPAFRYDDFFAVAIGYTIQPPVLNCVTNHHFHTMNLLLKHLQEMNYRRIGLCMDSVWDDKVENCWLGGMTLWHWKNPGLKVVPPFREQFSEVKAFQAWLRRDKPDVIISHDRFAEALKNLDYRIPRDIGFASLDLNPEEKYLSGACQNSRLIGRKAVNFLIDMLHSGERGIPRFPSRLLVESEWRPGKTLRPQN